jgi:hypothetical protein
MLCVCQERVCVDSCSRQAAIVACSAAWPACYRDCHVDLITLTKWISRPGSATGGSESARLVTQRAFE